MQPPAVGELCHRMVPTDRRHRPLVAVVERCGPASDESASNLFRNMAATLDRRLSDLRQRAAVIGRRLCDVADGKDLRMPVEREVLQNRDSAAATQLHAEQRRNGIGRDARGPHDRCRLDPATVAKHYRPGLHTVDADPDLHPYTTVDQGALRPFRQ